MMNEPTLGRSARWTSRPWPRPWPCGRPTTAPADRLDLRLTGTHRQGFPTQCDTVVTRGFLILRGAILRRTRGKHTMILGPNNPFRSEGSLLRSRIACSQETALPASHRAVGAVPARRPWSRLRRRPPPRPTLPRRRPRPDPRQHPRPAAPPTGGPAARSRLVCPLIYIKRLRRAISPSPIPAPPLRVWRAGNPFRPHAFVNTRISWPGWAGGGRAGPRGAGQTLGMPL